MGPSQLCGQSTCLELSLLQYRDRKEIERALTRRQKEALNRFLNENGKIAEHWDAIETIPPHEQWKNGNGKFGFHEESAEGRERKTA